MLTRFDFSARSVRHLSSSRDPIFSPPLQGEGWVGMGFGSRDNHHVPVFFHSPSLASESLSLACPRESNQREGHPGRGASAARRFATGGRVPLTGHPWPAPEEARSLALPLRALSSALRRPTRGPGSRAPLIRLRHLLPQAGEGSCFYRVGLGPPLVPAFAEMTCETQDASNSTPPHEAGSTSAIVCENVQQCPPRSCAPYCLSPYGKSFGGARMRTPDSFACS